MIKHIVFWKLAEFADGHTRAENIERMKAAAEHMRSVIPGIIELEIGEDLEGSDAAWDVALYSAFETREALDAYQVHPEHVKVKELVARIRTDRAVVDYEV